MPLGMTRATFEDYTAHMERVYLMEYADETDKRLQPWRRLALGTRVEIRKGSRKGERGSVTDILDDRIDGMARYGLRLDEAPNSTADYCRFELKPVRAKRTDPTKPGKVLIDKTIAR